MARISRRQEAPSEFQDKVLDIRRVTRVVAGGKRFRFRATVAIGNGMGKVGIGVGKGGDVAQAVEKAKRDAKKKTVVFPLKGRTILHQVESKFRASRVLIKPAAEGSGLKAGGATRVVLMLGGVKDATSKTIGRTKNKLTNAVATINALRTFKAAKANREISKANGTKAEN